MPTSTPDTPTHCVPSASLTASRRASGAHASRVRPRPPLPTGGRTQRAPTTTASPARPNHRDEVTCTICGSPITLTFWGPTGFGVCRDDLNPNQDDEGQHVTGLMDVVA